eukprot:6776989-Alexandrium_andersonii.AAC.1
MSGDVCQCNRYMGVCDGVEGQHKLCFVSVPLCRSVSVSLFCSVSVPVFLYPCASESLRVRSSESLCVCVSIPAYFMRLCASLCPSVLRPS